MARGLPPDWRAKLDRGDRGAIARAITAVENETDQLREVLDHVAPRVGRAHVVGITGSPGVGKSTLVSALIASLRARARSVGVLAVDPSSPRTGGAVLGDRIRLSEHGADADVFFRSVANRGHAGGVSRTAARVVDVLDASGRDVILLETVGAGQSEVEVARLAHSTLVVTSAGGLGDSVQAIKAGILEIADILVVNKCDLPGKDRTVSQLRETTQYTSTERWAVPIVEVAARDGVGIEALVDAVELHGASLDGDAKKKSAATRVRRLVELSLLDAVRRRVEDTRDPALEAVVDKVLAGELSASDAARELLAALAAEPDG